jgi:hypothetical protein
MRSRLHCVYRKVILQRVSFWNALQRNYNTQRYETNYNKCNAYDTLLRRYTTEI